ncbi:aldo/keto reductase [Alkaliflexus imshenetskii]|jgi:methylglyoxal/glyoxal reductase|uniref:aldo/keto reductase n=1 Tax=Alkaliflexus imshenetskii TaxID=286730 RepID=UPI00047E3A2A|nr:aldo/keto reductase [Alkaliflexus imshenetskii]
MKITDIKGTVTLNNGVEMPYFGLGVFKAEDGQEVIDSVSFALEAGYRHIDTAAIYQNERGVGQAIRQSEVDRKEIFVTSKVWNSDQGYDSTIKAFHASLVKLDLSYLDLFLVHWPVKGKYKETYRALETLYEEGKIKAIGVSNFLVHHLEDLLSTAKIVPAINQIEYHPYLTQPELINTCFSNGIVPEAWSPLMQGQVTEVAELTQLSQKYYKTEAQLVLRWNLQKGIITIPKSSRKSRILENANIFDFEITAEDMVVIDSLNRNQRIGADPDNFNF